MSTFYIYKKEDDLLHYGILGMKWGIRRYQNANGSYTKEGLARYNHSKNRYDKAKANYKTNKSSVNATKLKLAESQLKTDYKQLSKAYKADKGKELAKSGKTIDSIAGSPSHRLASFLLAGSLFSTRFALDIPKNIPTVLNTASGYRRIVINGKPIPLKNVAIALGLSGVAVSTLVIAKNAKKAMELDAYEKYKNQKMRS